MAPARSSHVRHNTLSLCLALSLAVVCGCTESAMRLQSPEAFEAALADVQLVRDISVPFGVHPMQVDSVVLVGGLPGTGSDPPPSSARSLLLSQMQKRDVARPNQILASPATTLAIARGHLKPGIQKGDRFDVEVFVPRDVETTNLRGGMMYETRLRERAVLGGRVREGEDLAIAKGPLLVDPMADPERDSPDLRRAVILGGGVALKSRPLGLLLKPDQKDVRTSARIGTAINRRFHLNNRGIKSGVAKPKTDGYVELKLHPRYKDNLQRYLRVVHSIALRETDAERQMRLQLLERQLLDPVTCDSAAIRLEAIGREAEDVLKKGLASSNREVRFHASESLAFLDHEAAAPVLAEAARDKPNVRARALAALSAMDQPEAREELVKLLDVASAETRYGAFRALRAMDANDPVVRGESMDGRFTYHVVRSAGPSMIHVSRSKRPEVVLFGPDERLHTPLILDAGKHIRVNAAQDGRVSISSFVPGQTDQQLHVSDRIDDVVRAIVQLGGSYPDVVQALVQAKTSHSMQCRLEVDAIPGYQRPHFATPGPVIGRERTDEIRVGHDTPSGDRDPSDETAASDHASFPAENPPKTAVVQRDSSWPMTGKLGKIWGRMQKE